MWGSAQMVPGSPRRGPQETGALGMLPAPGAAGGRAGGRGGPELHHRQAARPAGWKPQQRSRQPWPRLDQAPPPAGPASPVTGLQPWLGRVWGAGLCPPCGVLARGWQASLLVRATAHLSARRGAHEWPTSGKRSAVSAHLSADVALLHLLHPCSPDRGKLHLPGGHLQPKRGIVMLVLGRL